MTTAETTRDPRRAILLILALDVAAPLALFYGLRAAGVSQWWALALGALPPIGWADPPAGPRGRADATCAVLRPAARRRESVVGTGARCAAADRLGDPHRGDPAARRGVGRVHVEHSRAQRCGVVPD